MAGTRPDGRGDHRTASIPHQTFVLPADTHSPSVGQYQTDHTPAAGDPSRPNDAAHAPLPIGNKGAGNAGCSVGKHWSESTDSGGL